MIKKYKEYIKEEYQDLQFDINPNISFEEIEKNGTWVDDYSVDEYDEIEGAGIVNVYEYKGYRWYIVTWKPESERGSIGKELLRDLTKKL